jgi:hypothetical protein
MSPVCILAHDKKLFSGANSFVSNRANNYPFVHEITSVFDINTAKYADISQINFKNLYNEYSFYCINNSFFGVFFNEFSKKYLLNTNESLINYVLVTYIIYHNFFLNLRTIGGFFDKSIYSASLNFVLLYNLTKSYSFVGSVSYFNVNFLADLSNIYTGSLSNLVIKNLDVASSSDLSVKIGTTYASYVSVYGNYSNIFVKSNANLYNVFKEWTLSLNNTFSEKINANWSIKFSGSDITKYISGSTLGNMVIYYLRKSKVFNKGRYSRNRQTYRTGVYWSLYVNIIAMVGLTYWFYRFTINFGYVWWMLYIFVASFFVPKAVKYRLYNPCELFKSFVADILWLGYQFNLISAVFVNTLANFWNLFKKLV